MPVADQPIHPEVRHRNRRCVLARVHVVRVVDLERRSPENSDSLVAYAHFGEFIQIAEIKQNLRGQVSRIEMEHVRARRIAAKVPVEGFLGSGNLVVRARASTTRTEPPSRFRELLGIRVMHEVFENHINSAENLSLGHVIEFTPTSKSVIERTSPLLRTNAWNCAIRCAN